MSFLYSSCRYWMIAVSCPMQLNFKWMGHPLMGIPDQWLMGMPTCQNIYHITWTLGTKKLPYFFSFCIHLYLCRFFLHFLLLVLYCLYYVNTYSLFGVYIYVIDRNVLCIIAQGILPAFSLSKKKKKHIVVVVVV